jgi:transposase
MKKPDARLLSPSAQEDLRRRVVGAIQKGMSQSEAARVFGTSRQAVNGWVAKVRGGGLRSLRARRRGRPRVSRLAPHQAATTVRLILGRCPDQLKLPFALWTRAAVQHLLRERFDLEVSVWTVGRYLKRWGFTPQKPVRKAFEQDPEAVRRWLEEEYPRIRSLAKREKALIHWGDEMGMRSDHQTGTSYGRKGQTPVIPGTGQRFRCNLISTVTNRGQLAFMVFRGRFNGRRFLVFLRRLLRQSPRKVFLIVDRHPVHEARAVTVWLEKRRDRIRLFLLPSYSPELNPDELLNQDVKSNAVGRERPRDLEEMVGTVRSYLWGTQRRRDIVLRYFQEEHVRYAAI